jgi:hypothetical protein
MYGGAIQKKKDIHMDEKTYRSILLSLSKLDYIVPYVNGIRK